MAVNKFDNSMLDAGTIGTTANKLLQMDGSAKIPAVDGSLLTGIPSSFTKSASDPVITTNPSGGVGTIWANTTSGEVYCCTDATAGANVWTNVGAGSDNVAPYYFHSCTTYGFSGIGYTDAAGNHNSIDRIAFASDGNATDQGDPTVARRGNSSSSSTTHAYCGSGYSNTYTNIIDKFAMASPANSTDVGDLTSTGAFGAGMTSTGYGYKAGKDTGASTVIDRYSHTSDGNSTNWGTLSAGRDSALGGSSETHGYILGAGGGGTTIQKQIDKISFASAGTSTDIGDLITVKSPAGVQSTVGYIYATGNRSPYATTIQKISTTSDGNAVERGTDTLTLSKANVSSGFSSSTYGYEAGGSEVGSYSNSIAKFVFATTADSTNVGDLSIGRGEGPLEGQY